MKVGTPPLAFPCTHHHFHRGGNASTRAARVCCPTHTRARTMTWATSGDPSAPPPGGPAAAALAVEQSDGSGSSSLSRASIGVRLLPAAGADVAPPAPPRQETLVRVVLSCGVKVRE